MTIRTETVDGKQVVVMYMNDDFEPVEPEKATIVKMDWPDGTTTYAVPSEEKAA